MPGYISEGATWEVSGSEAPLQPMARPGEVERDRATEVLERTVAERTAQLQETVAELEAFSYSVSHDMRSSLRAMQNYAQGLLEDYGSKLDSNGTAALSKIQRACHRLDLQFAICSLQPDREVSNRVETDSVGTAGRRTP